VPVQRVMSTMAPFALHMLLEAAPPAPRATFPPALHARLVHVRLWHNQLSRPIFHDERASHDCTGYQHVVDTSYK
jgi:hypothetical protein